MSKETHITLKFNNIKQTIKQVKDYKEDLDRRIDRYMNKLGKLGVAYAKASVPSGLLDYDGNDPLTGADIYYDYDSKTKKLQIIAQGMPCLWVEYGTGDMGRADPHPDIQDSYAYKRVGYWEYPISESLYRLREAAGLPGGYAPNKGYYVAVTKGMPSTPYMYNTAQYLKEHMKDIEL